MNDVNKLPAQKVGGDIPSIPWVTVTTSNASIRVKLSCNFFTKMAKGVCEPANAFDLRAVKASSSSS
jgi:hypothetical protein